MPGDNAKTIALSQEDVAIVDAAVERGDFDSESAVVSEALRLLEDRSALEEAWLNGPVAEAYDRLRADPDSAIPMDAAFEQVRARHRGRQDDDR